MAAYGALVSVMQIMDQLHRHPHPPISLDEKQSESLAANVTFLQEFLEGYNPHVSYTAEADPLESRIAEAAYAAEDVIESYIVDQINLARSTDHVEKISSIEFSQGLEKVIEEMDLIKMEIKEKMKDKKMGVQIIKKKQSTTDAASSISSSTAHAQKVRTMVGFDDVMSEMLDKLTGGGVNRQIIPIVGMGGLGKTTLARNVYEKPLIKERFHVRAWSTISQVHNATKILSEILGQIGLDSGGDLSENELGDNLYQHLICRRYLVVMDDIWSIEAWDRVRCYFPDNTHGSRIVITTRLSNLASQFNPSYSLEMKFLDEARSWSLFSKTVFGEEICPPELQELEEIGKKIVEDCRGLPLSIVVAGGLLSKSEPTRENWEVIKENLSSIVNSEDDGSCLQILYTSYNNLPVYIKPCFLYLAIFDEDEKIEVSELIQMWVAEGFIKPNDGKSLEEVGEEYLEELIDRNLVLVEKHDHCGDVATIKVHDLVRDLAMREAAKDRFLYSSMQRSSDDTEISQGIISTHRHRRIAIPKTEKYPLNEFLGSAEATAELSLVRTLIGEFSSYTSFSLPCFKLLRVYMVGGEIGYYYYDEEIFFPLLNLRLLVVPVDIQRLLIIPSYLWNLQTVVTHSFNSGSYCTFAIWKMPQLRAVMTGNDNPFRLPDPPLGGEEVVLENLHTLSEVANLKFSEEVLKRIPNVRILKLCYEEEDDDDVDADADADDDDDDDDVDADADDDDDLEEEEEEEEEEEVKKCDYYLNNLHRLFMYDDDELEEEEEEEEEEEKKCDYCLNNLHRLNKLQDLRLLMFGRYFPWMQEFTLPYSLKQLALRNTKLPWEDMVSKIGCLPFLQVLKLKKDAVVGSVWETVEGQFPSLKFLKIDHCDDLERWITDDSTHFPRLQHLVLRLLKRLEDIPSSIGDLPTLRSIRVKHCSDYVVESARRIVEEQEEQGNQDIQLQVDYSQMTL